MHSAGIVHRDLKTKNLLLEATPGEKFPFSLRVGDFGICRVIQNQDIKSQNFLNIFGISTKYAAPEVFWRSFLPNVNNDAEDEKTDVYSFAVWSAFLALSCSLLDLICIYFQLSFSVWEIFTRDIPWDGVSSEQVQRRVCGGERLPARPTRESS